MTNSHEADKYQGVVHSFNTERSFGFIRPNHSSQDIFFHSRQFRARRTPQIGETVIFELSTDKQGRAVANNVQELSFVTQKQQERAKRQQAKQAYHAYQERQQQKTGMLNTLCVFAVGYLMLVTVLIIKLNLAKAVLVWYVMIGVLSFSNYYRDKLSAQDDTRRVSEKTLHIYDLLGGWIGASFAQRLLDHKTSKQSFRHTYYKTIALNILIVISYIYYFK